MQNLDTALFNDMILQKRKLLQSAPTRDPRETTKSKWPGCISSSSAAPERRLLDVNLMRDRKSVV